MSIKDSFVDLVGRILGTATEKTFCGSWVCRGMSNAIHRLCVTSGEERDIIALWAYGFEAGALDALRLARVVLSDPAVRGKETLALDMIEAGATHADIVAHLKTERGARAVDGAKVIPFGRVMEGGRS